jgi:YesN/AraC family two-component response regulator
MEQAMRLKELAKDMSALYVEDEKSVREETAEFLKKFFLSVDIAKNGKEGVEQFKRHRQDIVITDIVMPIMEGNDMMAEIRAIEPDVPVIIVSAYDFADYATPKSGKGVNAFLKKPTTYAEFVKTLCQVIEATKHQDDTVTALKKRVKNLENRLELLEGKLAELPSKS